MERYLGFISSANEMVVTDVNLLPEGCVCVRRKAKNGEKCEVYHQVEIAKSTASTRAPRQRQLTFITGMLGTVIGGSADEDDDAVVSHEEAPDWDTVAAAMAAICVEGT